MRMTPEQLQYAYLQRIRQQQIYRAYAAGYALKQHAQNVTLKVHKAYDTDEGSQAQFFINGSKKEFDVVYEFPKGTVVDIKVFPPEDYTAEKFLYWSDDLKHTVYSSERQLILNNNIELTAVFHTDTENFTVVSEKEIQRALNTGYKITPKQIQLTDEERIMLKKDFDKILIA